MRPEMGTPARWAIHLVIMIPLLCLAVFLRDDSGFGAANFWPRFGSSGISIYLLWGGVLNVALLVGVPVAVFALLSRFVAPSRGLRVFFSIVLVLLGALVIGVEALVARERDVFVTDFMLSPEEDLAQRDAAEIQARFDALKARKTEDLCDEAFNYYEIGVENLDKSVADRLREAYSFDRKIVVGSKPIEIEATIDLPRLLYFTGASSQCMAHYEKVGDEFFQTGVFAWAALRYRAAASLAEPGSDERARLEAMYEAMKAVVEADAAPQKGG